MAKDEMVGQHHRLNGHELGQTLGDGGGRGSLVCYRPCGRDLVTEQQISHACTPWWAELIPESSCRAQGLQSLFQITGWVSGRRCPKC